MITYIVQVILFQILFLVVYDFFLKKETFHVNNRWYLIGTPVLSFVLPFIKISAIQETVPQKFLVLLPEAIISPEKIIEQTSFYSGSFLSIIFWCGVTVLLAVFILKLIRINQLILKNEIIKKQSYKLVLLPKQNNAFSFFNFIFIGKDISKEKRTTIIQHELIHSKQKHSFDLLFFEVLRIVMWFNPMVYIYQKRITLLHEYISDSEVVKTTEKEAYFNKLLSETFQVENISFVNQFYKQSLIKKRIIMMTKNKSNQFKKVKYLLLLPLLAGMLFYTSCETNSVTEEEVEVVVEQNKKLLQQKITTEIETVYENDVPYAIIEEVPVFPGCEGTKEEKKDCLSKKLQAHILKNFKPGLAKTMNMSKGIKKMRVLFRINEEGKVTDMNVRAPHPELKKEALRVLKTIPQMQPGKQRGKAVGMYYQLPISFHVE